MNSDSQDKSLWIAAITVVCVSAPTSLSGLATIVVEILRPGDAMPLETATDRALVQVFTWSFLISLFGLPLTVIGLVLGGLVVWKAGPQSRIGTLLMFTMGISLGTTAHFVSRSFEAWSRYKALFS